MRMSSPIKHRADSLPLAVDLKSRPSTSLGLVNRFLPEADREHCDDKEQQTQHATLTGSSEQRATGWRIHDPQGTAAVRLPDDLREKVGQAVRSRSRPYDRGPSGDDPSQEPTRGLARRPYSERRGGKGRGKPVTFGAPTWRRLPGHPSRPIDETVIDTCSRTLGAHHSGDS